MSQAAQPDSHHSKEKVVVAHVAGNAEEAMVIRGLLASNGIYSPGSESTDPFPLNEPLDASQRCHRVRLRRRGEFDQHPVSSI